MPLPRYRRPRINPIGRAAKRKAPTRRQSYAAVSRRAKGRCELCGTAQDPLDPHHAFGRGHLFGIPAEVCEHPACILGICRSCHDRIHDAPGVGVDLELHERARWQAVDNYLLASGSLESAGEFGDNPVAAMVAIVRAQEEAA